jgi:flagellar L-ring protein precursor FlgH
MIMKSSAFRLISSLITVALMGTGCSGYRIHDEKPDDPNYAPVYSVAPPPQPINVGSLYQPVSGMSLYADRRAFRVGDIIMVQLDERTIASKSTETSASKDSSITFGEDNILGRTVDFKGHSLLTGLDQQRGFDGSGEADQENSLSGTIAVTVSGVLPNGLLMIRGEKWMTLTRGEEFIRLRGLIRPEDIASDNSIESNKIADARISYAGTGELADTNRQGWGTRLFNSKFWPF